MLFAAAWVMCDGATGADVRELPCCHGDAHSPVAACMMGPSRR